MRWKTLRQNPSPSGDWNCRTWSLIGPDDGFAPRGCLRVAGSWLGPSKDAGNPVLLPLRCAVRHGDAATTDECNHKEHGGAV
jgi:hypothetical protein